MHNRVTSIQLPAELIASVDAAAVRARRASGELVTRSAMMRKLMLLGLERQAQLDGYAQDEQRQAQAREQRAQAAQAATGELQSVLQ